MTDVEALLT